jgi:hypothetical protein
MTRSAIRLPEILDEPAIMGVLKRLNLLATGQTSFGSKEVSASLKWARVPHDEIQRFMRGMEHMGLFREPAAIPERIPWRAPKQISQT